MKRFKFIFFLWVILIFSFNISFADELIVDSSDTVTVNTDVSELNFKIYSKRAIVYERNSKTILFEKNIYEKCAMASTTKIMTCILILENCDLNETVTISQTSASTPGSRLGLSVNDKISIKDLLYGLMLCSGNDAAVALAEYCSGSVENFANLMNQKANELNLTSTHFVTPHGLDSTEHYTTAYDFAILSDYALNNPLFSDIVGTKYYTVTINGISKSIHNTNELLGTVSDVYGIKTGYTSQAGRCLISSIKRNNLDVIIIIFGADTKQIRTNDSIKLINYVFENYETIDLESLINNKYNEYINYILPYISISKISKEISPYLEISFPKYYPVKKEFLNSIDVTIQEEKLSAPIQKGQKLASVNLIISNNQILCANICSAEYINKKQPFDYFLYFINEYKNFYKL